jgi:N-acetylneuraminic acid mutarotase
LKERKVLAVINLLQLVQAATLFKDVSGRPNEYAYVVAGGYDQRRNLLNSVEVFDKTANSWIKVKSMKKYRADATSVVYNGQVLVTRGISDGNHVVSSMEAFSRNASPFVPPSWSNLSVNLPRPLSGHRTVLYNGRLIVLGGYDEDRNACDMIYEIQLHFPFTTKVLSKLPSSTPFRGCGAVLANDKILMLGGTNSAIVTMYDITKNEFRELAPLPYGVCNMATIRFRDNVILVGGSDGFPPSDEKNTVVSYNIETQKSTMLPPMKHSRSQCCAVVDGNSLVVMGGHGQRRTLNSVEAFDFKTSTWSDLPSMNEARKGFIAEIV